MLPKRSKGKVAWEATEYRKLAESTVSVRKDSSFSSLKARRMTHQGAVLQRYNNELVKYLEDLSVRREELNGEIRQAEQEKKVVQDEIAKLTAQLECVCERLEWKHAAQQDLDKILDETEVAYDRILESSRSLLSFLKRETESLDKVIALIKNNVPADS